MATNSLAQTAEDASVLLELFSKTAPRDGEVSDDLKEMVENAFQSVLKLRRALVVVPVVEEEEGTECIICYSNAADTVLMPCKHLVLCIVGFFYSPPFFFFLGWCRRADGGRRVVIGWG